MKDPYSILREDSEPEPAWLFSYHLGTFPREEFFGSRTVYYPGSGEDGHPLKLFGGTHSAHCFVFADYGQSKAYVEDQLSDAGHPGHPKGYRPREVLTLKESDLRPNGWVPHLDFAKHGLVLNSFATTRPPGGPFCLFAVLERKPAFGADHGPLRIAILALGADGIAAFDALWAQSDSGPPPYAIVLQDHGFGGNWTRFGGASSPLWRLARVHPPSWLLVAQNTKPWPGYTCVSSLDPGGMHAHPRALFKRQNQTENR